jgi:hypothetical protein
LIIIADGVKMQQSPEPPCKQKLRIVAVVLL